MRPALLVRDVRALTKLLDGTDISEIEVEVSGIRVRLKRGAPPAPGTLHPGMPALLPAPVVHAGPAFLPGADAGHMVAAPASPGSPQKGLVTIDAPMVGTFYRSPAPDAPTYVEEDQAISEGQTICIIEAMKLMNEIKSEIAGRVVRVLAENGQPVEYGQPLFQIEPAHA